MNSHLRKLSRRYAPTLQKYLVDEQEAVLERAYELGRRAIAQGLGVLDMARVHQQALGRFLWPTLDPQDAQHILRAAEVFFLEALSPFEVTHRGFRETNVKLQHLIATLEERNSELAEINRELGIEIHERNRTEKALRESERHFRELFNQARRMEENLRNLSNQILHVQEEERKRISRELHDEVGQALTAVSVTLGALRNNGAGSSEVISPKLTEAQRLLRETMEAVHGFARELRPTILDELGLLPALRSCLKAFAERTGLRVHFRANPVAEKLGGDQKTVVFRIAQESLTNVARHAHASQVQIVIRKVKNGICMEVADNGRSFRGDSQGPARAKKRLGLLGMQERARLVNGKFTIKPRPGKGTTARVTIPFQTCGALPVPKPARAGRRAARSPARARTRDSTSKP